MHKTGTITEQTRRESYIKVKPKISPRQSIRSTYMIPKACVIDYVLSEDYAKYSKTLKARV